MDTFTKAEGRATPWNKGKLLGQKPPLKLKEIWAIRIRLRMNHRTRELALFNLAIDSKLRGCDLVGLRVYDVVQGSHVVARAIAMQKQTLRPVQFELTEQTHDAVPAWIATAHLKPAAARFDGRGPANSGRSRGQRKSPASGRPGTQKWRRGYLAGRDVIHWKRRLRSAKQSNPRHGATFNQICTLPAKPHDCGQI